MGAFGGIGGLLGFLLNFLTRDKTRVVKILTVSAIIIVGVIIASFVTKDQSDAELLKADWISQTIGSIEFESPTRLNFTVVESSNSKDAFYDDLKIHSYENDSRLTFFVQANLKVDTFSIKSVLFETLEVVLSKVSLNLDDVDLEFYEMADNKISTMLIFNENGEDAFGYSFIHKANRNIESIWLIPSENDFSEEYIDRFETGIISKRE